MKYTDISGQGNRVQGLIRSLMTCNVHEIGLG